MAERLEIRRVMVQDGEKCWLCGRVMLLNVAHQFSASGGIKVSPVQENPSRKLQVISDIGSSSIVKRGEWYQQP